LLLLLVISHGGILVKKISR